MTSNSGRKIIIAVFFCAVIIMSRGAQASGLFALGGDPAPVARQLGLFDQAVQWLSGAWTDLKVAFGQDETLPPPPLPECTTNCGDTGPGIDPLG